MTDGTRIDTTPSAAYLRALRAQRWSVAAALSELVDNAFGPGRGDASRCEITYDSQRRVLTVLDNGRGMDGVARLFKLGDGAGLVSGDIGFFGAGGSSAIIWLPDRVSVWTLRDGRINHDTVDWPAQISDGRYPMVSSEWEKANLSTTPPELLDVRHGTLIEMHLRRERTFHISNVQRDLSETYAPALRKHRTLVWTSLGKGGGTQNLAEHMPVFDPETSASFDGYLQVPNGDLLGVRGEVGLVPGLSVQKSRVAVGYGTRVIFRTRDCFQDPTGEERYQEAGVAGYIDLLEGWQPYLTLTKDDIADGPIRDTLMAWIFEKAKPILQQVKRQEIQLLLDDIALSITTGLAGRRVSTDVPTPVYGPGPAPEPGDGHSHIDIPPVSEGPEAKGKLPSGAVFNVEPLDDEGMGRVLCLAEPAGDAVRIFVNQDHPIVRMALERTPVNRAMLEVLITRELADLLEKRPDLCQRAFRSRRDREEIDSVSDEGKGRIIHRLLVDRVKHGPEEEMAPA